MEETTTTGTCLICDPRRGRRVESVGDHLADEHPGAMAGILTWPDGENIIVSQDTDRLDLRRHVSKKWARGRLPGTAREVVRAWFDHECWVCGQPKPLFTAVCKECEWMV